MGLRLVPSSLKMDRLSFSSFAGGSNTAAYFPSPSTSNPRFTFFFFSFFLPFPSTSHTYFIVHIQILFLALYFSAYLPLGVLILLFFSLLVLVSRLSFLFLGFTSFISTFLYVKY